MKEEHFVKMKSERVMLLHGQVGNIRSRVTKIQALLLASDIALALDLCLEVQEEVGYLENYLPPRVNKAPF